MIEALGSNSGYIYIADSQANAQGTNRNQLAAGEALEITVDNAVGDSDNLYIDLYNIWIDASVTGNRAVVSYVAEVSYDY